MIYPKTFEHKIGFDEIRTLLRERCLSTLGKEKIDDMSVSTNPTIINEWLQQVKEFRLLQEQADDFPMQFFFDVRESVARLRLEGTHLTRMNYSTSNALWKQYTTLSTISTEVKITMTMSPIHIYILHYTGLPQM